MKSIKLYAILFLLAFYGNAISADHVVKRSVGAPPNMFVFDPPVIKIAVGDVKEKFLEDLKEKMK